MGVAGALFELVAPSRFGANFRRLLASSWTSNLGDGIAVAAGPLLVASQTHNAFLIASAASLQWLAPLLFGLSAGALSDRLDRRLIVISADLVRVGILALLALSIVTHTVSIAVVLGLLFALGVAEVFGDNTTATLLPMVVSRDDLVLAQPRLMFGFITVNRLIGPPVGAALFAAGMVLPFAGQAVLVAAGVLFVSRLVLPPLQAPSTRTVRADVRAGFGWVRRHAAVRTLVLTIFVFNLTFGAAWSVLVLYSRDRLGLGAVGFGLITTVEAAGGLLGTAGYGRLVRHVSLGAIMRIGLVIETFTHLVLAVTTSPAVALPTFFVFGAHAFVWSTTSATVRQRAVPHGLQGRVNSVNTVGTFGGLVIGSGIGGLLAEHIGLTAPFWFGFAGSALFLVLLWRQLAHIAHADSDADADADADSDAPHAP
ncbi:MFS transporter [uncultured Jatrophihabitans sp.]|uniref:MFS transporter n=1 Tax=uncultured Jatrophihabitans sp. TaxID=1610747 RepID=UPI0035CABF05